MIEKIYGCKNISENSSTTKLTKRIQWGSQCLKYLHLEAYKISMMYIEVKLVWKRFVNY